VLSGSGSIDFYLCSGSAALSQRITAPCALGQPAYDQNGALWGVAAYGIILTVQVRDICTAGYIAGIRPQWKVYVEDPSTIALDVYPSSSSTTMIRQIILPKAAVQASVDSTGNRTSRQLRAFTNTPNGKRNAAPVASNLGAEGQLRPTVPETSTHSTRATQQSAFGKPGRLIECAAEIDRTAASTIFANSAFGLVSIHVGDIYVLGGGAFDEGGPVYYVPPEARPSRSCPLATYSNISRSLFISDRLVRRRALLGDHPSLCVSRLNTKARRI